MQGNHFNGIKAWFLEYTAAYLTGDADQRYHIGLKRVHSLRVCAWMQYLARQLAHGGNGVETAGIIGLLHDVGRFEQYARYRTFKDRLSFDHAAAGIRVIEADKLLTGLSPLRQGCIQCAIAHHNKVRVPDDVTGDRLYWSRMIRDADKLDIWRVVLNEYENGSSGLLDDYPQDPEISDKVYGAIVKGAAVNMNDVKTLNDFKLLQMAWVFDLNFTPTLRMVRRRRYLERIVNSMPPDPRIKSVYTAVRDVIRRKISTLGVRASDPATAETAAPR